LVGRGFNRSMFISTSKGITQPIEANDTPEGRAKNRRVEVRLGE